MRTKGLLRRELGAVTLVGAAAPHPTLQDLHKYLLQELSQGEVEKTGRS